MRPANAVKHAPTSPPLPLDIAATVRVSLAEDVGTGDLTAALIDAGATATAEVIVKEPAVLCGTAWFDEVFRQLDTRIRVRWLAEDGDNLAADARVAAVGRAAYTVVFACIQA